LGNVILEAWSHGVPVISTRTHGAIELIQDGINGLLVPCSDSKAISEAIKSLVLQNESAIWELASNGKSLLEQKYSKKKIVESYLNLYDHLLAVGR
jgi:glycosyltransferase involved in cell wall biosynthesis